MLGLVSRGPKVGVALTTRSDAVISPRTLTPQSWRRLYARTSVYNQVFLRCCWQRWRRPILIFHDEVPTSVRAGVCRLGDEPDWYRADLHLTSKCAANLDDYLDLHGSLRSRVAAVPSWLEW